MRTDPSSGGSTEATPWYRVPSRDELSDGRVTVVNCGGTTVAIAHYDGEYADWKVVSVSSDGGFGQYMSEFTTAVKYDMDITDVLLTDSDPV